jgi:hypothetical protein
MENLAHDKAAATMTSFYSVTIDATVNELKEVLGEPAYYPGDGNWGDGKTTWNWIMRNSEGDVFTVYDWKYYREIGEDEEINWHIGGFNKLACIQARRDILKAAK